MCSRSGRTRSSPSAPGGSGEVKGQAALAVRATKQASASFRTAFWHKEPSPGCWSAGGHAGQRPRLPRTTRMPIVAAVPWTAPTLCSPFALSAWTTAVSRPRILFWVACCAEDGKPSQTHRPARPSTAAEARCSRSRQAHWRRVPVRHACASRLRRARPAALSPPQHPGGAGRGPRPSCKGLNPWLLHSMRGYRPPARRKKICRSRTSYASSENGAHAKALRSAVSTWSQELRRRTTGDRSSRT